MNKGDIVLLTKDKEPRFLPVGFLQYANPADFLLGEISTCEPNMLDCEVKFYKNSTLFGLLSGDSQPVTVRDILVKYDALYSPAAVYAPDGAVSVGNDVLKGNKEG